MWWCFVDPSRFRSGDDLYFTNLEEAKKFIVEKTSKQDPLVKIHKI